MDGQINGQIDKWIHKWIDTNLEVLREQVLFIQDNGVIHLRGYSTNEASRNINVKVIIYIKTIVENKGFIKVLKALKNIFWKNFMYS